jgi:hypothetical protein
LEYPTTGKKELTQMKRLFIALAFCLAPLIASGQSKQSKSPVQIILGSTASEMERYAAKELQRYLYQISGTLPSISTNTASVSKPSFVVGMMSSNPLLAKLVKNGLLSISQSDPGPQGYVLKRTESGGVPVMAIAGSDEVGCLYGVYGLLADHYGIGFFLGGDMLPEKSTALNLVDVDEKKSPAMYIRGFLPWTNFPQSATSYSWEDWKFILDQMAKMRLNFIHIHNYNGELGHNEMYHNFTYKGYTSRVWMPTARQAHAWAMSPWDVNKYRFGAADLFDDYDFGAECALHNETLTNEEVFRKSASLFQNVIDYAHTRGVKVGLGLDIDLIPKDYKVKADDPEVVKARVDQLASDYPNLDYLLCFQSENVGKDPQFYDVWKKIFLGFYQGVKERMTTTRVAVAGWGLNPASIAALPPDVICAPISYYSDRCETGAIYGDREYWGCPWLERDFYSSEYYYPYNLHLANTISAYKDRAPNMKGFYCLTWRLTDAVEPKMYFIARAPWENAGQTLSSRSFYRDYARLAYGSDAADEIAAILDQNEPFASDYAECEGTPPFTRLDARGIFQIERFHFLGDKPDSAMELSAAAYTDAYGIGKNRCEEGGECIDWIDAGEWAKYANVDFGTSAKKVLEARVASATEGGIIELRLDTLTGPVIGRCVVNNTGGLQRWATVRTTIKPISGRHTLHLNFVSDRDPLGDFDKAARQLQTIDKWKNAVKSPAQRARLDLLRSRIAAAKDHIELNRDFDKYQWPDLPGAARSWVENFTSRVTDISSLGNVMSSQNRYIQKNYVAKEDTLRSQQAVKPPSVVTARGTKSGAVISWKSNDRNAGGFNIYRDGKRLNGQPLTDGQTSYTDSFDGKCTYAVSVLNASGKEGLKSVPSACEAGNADRTPPHIVMVSPPASNPIGQPIWVKARMLDNRSYESISATLYHRSQGEDGWKKSTMQRKTKAIFAVSIPANEVGQAGVEYYIEASDGSATSLFPASAPSQPLSVTTFSSLKSAQAIKPIQLMASGQILIWTGAESTTHWYRIYRGVTPDFNAGPATYVTYVSASSKSFKDNGEGFDGVSLKGKWYYRITVVDKAGNESMPSEPVLVEY